MSYLIKILAAGAIAFSPLVIPAVSGSAQAAEQTIQERIFKHRAIEAVIWGIPLLSYKAYRDALVEAGVSENDVGYYSKIQDWKYQTATPNNTTPYITFHWNIEDGPIVVEIPPATEDVGVFGTLMDAWQRALDDVGGKGRDGGRGAKYLMVPKGYTGALLPGAFVYEQRTNNGWGLLRAIIKDTSEESLAKAAEYVRGIKIYPLAESASPKTEYVDLYGTLLEMTPVLDGGAYAELHAFLQEELVEPGNHTMMGLLAGIGIKKNEPFEPTPKAQAVFDSAAPEALEYMIEQYHRTYSRPVYPGKKWSTLLPPGGVETGLTYEYPSYFDYDAKGALYYAVITSAKNFGSATYYVGLAEDPDGAWLEGGQNYKLTVPADVPASDFWAVTAYDLQTASYIREVEKGSVDSNLADLQTNTDGSVDVYFGPKAPEGKESNWIPTDPKGRFFLLFRFYGPKAAAFDGSFELNDMERLE
jgi:hypothetical protein